MSELSADKDSQKPPAGRFLTLRRAALGLAAAAVLTGATFAIANEIRLAPLRVEPHPVSQTPGALKVASNETIPASVALEATETVVEDTEDFAYSFAQSLISARSSWDAKASTEVTAVADECLSAWAKEHLAEYAGTSQYDVVDACGRLTAIVVGASGVDERVLVFGATQENAPENVKRVRSVLIESNAAQMAFASVRSSDANAILMAAAALPAAPAPTAPPALNVRPPGVEIVPVD